MSRLLVSPQYRTVSVQLLVQSVCILVGHSISFRLTSPLSLFPCTVCNITSLPNDTLLLLVFLVKAHFDVVQVISYCSDPVLMDRDSSVSIATRYGLEGPGIESRREARFSAPVQASRGAHPAISTVRTESLPGVKRPERGVDQPPPSSAQVKKSTAISLLPLGLCALF
jgi:hypothetical protein